MATFSIYNTGERVAGDLSIPLVAHYTNNHGSPRSVHNSVHLPLGLAVAPCPPEKSAAYKVCWVVVCCVGWWFLGSYPLQLIVDSLSNSTNVGGSENNKFFGGIGNN